jgi:hypothetical protein
VLAEKHADADAGHIEAIKELVDLREVVEGALAAKVAAEFEDALGHHGDDVGVALHDRLDKGGKHVLVGRVFDGFEVSKLAEGLDVPIADRLYLRFRGNAMGQILKLGDAVGEADRDLTVEELSGEEELLLGMSGGAGGEVHHVL